MWEELIFAEILILVVEILLVMRREYCSYYFQCRLFIMLLFDTVYVLYNQNKLILALLITLFITEVAVMVTVMAIVLPKMRFSVNCLVSGTPGVFMVFWYIGSS